MILNVKLNLADSWECIFLSPMYIDLQLHFQTVITYIRTWTEKVSWLHRKQQALVSVSNRTHVRAHAQETFRATWIYITRRPQEKSTFETDIVSFAALYSTLFSTEFLRQHIQTANYTTCNVKCIVRIVLKSIISSEQRPDGQCSTTSVSRRSVIAEILKQWNAWEGGEMAV